MTSTLTSLAPLLVWVHQLTEMKVILGNEFADLEKAADPNSEIADQPAIPLSVFYQKTRRVGLVFWVLPNYQ